MDDFHNDMDEWNEILRRREAAKRKKEQAD